MSSTMILLLGVSASCVLISRSCGSGYVFLNLIVPCDSIRTRLNLNPSVLGGSCGLKDPKTVVSTPKEARAWPV